MAGRGQADAQLEQIVESVVERLGFELVDLERAGARTRPILRLRIDRVDAEPGSGVTVDECAGVSRELEQVLDAREDLLPSYILEVSSPGIERPLRKRRDFERSVGREIALKGFEPLARGSKRVEGTLLGIEGSGIDERLRLRLNDGTEVQVDRSAVAKANLVFRWDRCEFGKKVEEHKA
jgi:ribosome maturation factor RimP